MSENKKVRIIAAGPGQGYKWAITENKSGEGRSQKKWYSAFIASPFRLNLKRIDKTRWSYVGRGVPGTRLYEDYTVVGWNYDRFRSQPPPPEIIREITKRIEELESSTAEGNSRHHSRNKEVL